MCDFQLNHSLAVVDNKLLNNQRIKYSPQTPITFPSYLFNSYLLHSIYYFLHCFTRCKNTMCVCVCVCVFSEN